MKNFLLSILIILTGFFFYKEAQVNIKNENIKGYVINYDDMKSFETGYDFLDIFFNNLLVGFTLSIFGFMSGGIITVVVLFWNGYILSIIYHLVYKIIDYQEIIYYSKHIPLEIIALIMFSSIGFRGFFFYKEAFLYKKLKLNEIPKINEFPLPITLLFIASIIEAL